jgi:hypothetical protein
LVNHIVHDLLSVIKVDGFRWLFCRFVFFHLIFSLLAKIYHQLVEHVAHNFNVLIVDFLLEVVKACLDNIAIKLLCNEKLSDQIHVSIHLFFLPVEHLLVIV